MNPHDLSELLSVIQEQQKLHSIKKDQHLQEVHAMLEATPTSPKNHQLLDLMALKSTQVLHKLKSTALDVEQEVQSVALQATKAMNSFESLRHQKQNIERVLNALSAFTELKRVRMELPRAIEQRDIAACLKLAQGFLAVEGLLMQEFCQGDFGVVKGLMEVELVALQKEQFEEALRKNDLQGISLCACLAKVLSQESGNSLERVQDVHGRELRKKLLELEEQMFEKVNNKYEEYVQVEKGEPQKEYDFPFLWHFVKILEKVNEQGERFAENILSFYGEQGLNELQYYLLEQVSNPFLTGVIKRVRQFYEMDKQQSQQVKVSLLQALQNKEMMVDTKHQSKLSLYNEEVATIASQFNQFLQHISQLGRKQDTINQIFSTLHINDTILDVLQVYLQHTKTEIHLSLEVLFQRDESLHHLWNFDKQRIAPLCDAQEALQGNGFHEWLEEVFLVVKQAATQAMNTGNCMIASAVIAYINSDILADELYALIVQLLNRYLKKEYFAPNSISLNAKYVTHNTFIILLFNIVSSVPKYLRTLKSQLYHELQAAGGSQSHQQMIVGAIEELVDVNHKKYSSMMADKIKTLADNLKWTVRDVFEPLKSLSFIINENVIVEQEREYTKLFSQQFKLVFGPALDQWRHQLTQDNYQQLSEQLCHSIAKTLESIIMSKQYHQMGAIIVEKEVRSIVNFFAQATSLHVKQCFVRVQLITETLMLESVNDMEEFLSSSAVGELSLTELKKLAAMRVDLHK